MNLGHSKIIRRQLPPFAQPCIHTTSSYIIKCHQWNVAFIISLFCKIFAICQLFGPSLINPVCGLDYIPFIFQASPVSIGGRPAYVEEKRSTNSRGKLGLCS